MAIVGTVAGEHESKWGISEMSDFDAAVDEAVNFERMQGPMPSVDNGVFRDANVKGGDGRFRNGANDYVSGMGGLRVISFSDLVVRHDDLGLLLYLVGQNVSEGAGTPFEKTYTFYSATTQPNFAADAGSFCQVGIYDTIAGYHRIYTSCILRTLTLSVDLADDGLLRASGEFISGRAENTTQTFNTGTWVYSPQDYWNFHVTPTKKIATVDTVLYGFDITINNNAVRVGSTGANGECETYAIGTGETGYDISGNVKVKYDTNVQDLFGRDSAGTSTSIQLACGTDGATGNFDFTCNSCLLQGVGSDHADARGHALEVPFVATTTAVFTCSDAKDRAW